MYQTLIYELIGCEAWEAAWIEAYMRLEYGTLDKIPRAQFTEEARAILPLVRQAPDESKALAISYGLLR